MLVCFTFFQSLVDEFLIFILCKVGTQSVHTTHLDTKSTRGISYSSSKAGSPPWYALHDGEKPMIVGHHDHLHNGHPFIFQDRVFCLDTSCVHGGTLTGLLLPDFKIVSVPSRHDYWRETQKIFAQANPPRQVAPPRQILPDRWNETSELILEKIAALAQAESRRILAVLQYDLSFSESTPRQQAKAYAAAVGRERPWSALLHKARNGEIHLDTVSRKFKSHAEARDLLSRLNGESDM
jgi:hypothetical protein